MKLLKPTLEYKQQLLNFKEEFYTYNENTIPGSELLDKQDSFNDWLDYVTQNANKDTVSKDWVQSDTFMAIEDKQVVGMIVIRHELNDFLKNFGHIGYSVRPTKRNKGIATLMLQEIIEYAKTIPLKNIQISAEEENPASIKVIEKNGGEYERSFKYVDRIVNIYNIKL